MLSKVDLFKGLSDQQLDQITDKMKRQEINLSPEQSTSDELLRDEYDTFVKQCKHTYNPGEQPETPPDLPRPEP